MTNNITFTNSVGDNYASLHGVPSPKSQVPLMVASPNLWASSDHWKMANYR
jgi:hypothetical protein